MSRGTRLFQQPGSPLIQGHSRTERSSVIDWAVGLAVSVVLALGWFIYRELDPAAPFGAAEVLAAGRATVVRFAPGAAIGAAVGIPVARAFGWRRRWQATAVFGLVVGAATVWLTGAFGV